METHSPSSNFVSLRTALSAALTACLLASCGGGGDAGGGMGGTGVAGSEASTVSTGVMTKGSTIVNGVRFEDTTANISIDDMPKTAAALQNGMVVKVVGTVNADGINGTAQRVKALIEVRGFPTTVNPSANPQSLVVNGQTVVADDQTVFSNLANFNAITTNTLIEVHGLRGNDGRILATRIEANLGQMADSSRDEIRGVVVANPNTTNPTTFSIGGQPINFSGTVTPTGATWQNGSVVEVYCSPRPCIMGGVFQASLLKVEDAQDAAFRPASGQRVEAEGLISGFTQHPGNFSVAGTPVTTTSSTRFEGGVAADLANNVKVEAEGSWDGTRLVASKIEFKRSVIRLEGNVTAGGSQFTMDVAGHLVNIKTDSFTDGSVPAVFSGCIEVRGQRSGSATPPVVTAGEIRLDSCSGGGDRHRMQAPVEQESGTTLTLLGFPIDVGGSSVEFRDTNDRPISRDVFLNAVAPAGTNAAGSVPGTLVKVSFIEGTTAVREVELED